MPTVSIPAASIAATSTLPPQCLPLQCRLPQHPASPCPPANDPGLLPSLMAEPTDRIFHNSWASRHWPRSQILPMFMSQLASVQSFFTEVFRCLDMCSCVWGFFFRRCSLDEEISVTYSGVDTSEQMIQSRDLGTSTQSRYFGVYILG
jgi:hypothetical protein